MLPDFGSELIDWLKEPEVLSKPISKDFMPDWAKEDYTHFQMYENVTEGTPVSPVIASAKELAEWLAKNLRKDERPQYQFSAKAWLKILTSDNPVVYLIMTKRK